MSDHDDGVIHIQRDGSGREYLLAMPKAPINIAVDRGAATQARLRMILIVAAASTLIAWAGYFTSGGKNLFVTLGVSEGVVLAIFVTGLISTFAFALLKVIMSFSSRWQGADVDAIESGHYLWHKTLSVEAANQINQTSTAGYADKQNTMLKVLAGVCTATALLGSLGGIGEPNFGEYFVTVVLMTVLVFAFIGGFFWLIFWVSRPTQFLMNGLNQIVFTADGLLVEPIYWPWDTTGFRLEEIALIEEGTPKLDLLFANHIKGQMQRHELSIPLDSTDLPNVRILIQLLGNYRARSALKDEVQQRLNPVESAHVF